MAPQNWTCPNCTLGMAIVGNGIFKGFLHGNRACHILLEMKNRKIPKW